MSSFEDTERKEKPEKEIVEKLDFQQIIWMQMNDCRILHIKANCWDGYDMFAHGYYHSVLGLANLLCGITDETFENQIMAIREECAS